MLALLARPLTYAAQSQEEDQPILPETISEQDIEMRGRFARQWKEDATQVVLFTGAFQLDVGRRSLSADNAVVWIEPKRSDPEGRKYYELTVYLSGSAEVREPAGTSTADKVLLVSNLRTYGRVVKYDDAHSPESQENSELYQQALRDRVRIEAELASTQPTDVEVQRPAELDRPKPPQRVVRFLLPQGTEPAQTPDGEAVQIATGRVYFAQSGNPDSPVLEIQADSAVIFPVERGAAAFLGDEATRAASQPGSTTQPSLASRPAQRAEPPTSRPSAGDEPDVLKTPSSFIRAVYLEGDVILTLGDRVIRASRLFYDFERDRALILDAVFRAEIPGREVPLYVRADEIRQLSAREFSAEHARVTTSEFYTPHYHVGAEKVYIRDRTQRDATGRPAGPLAGTYELRNATLNVENVPIMFWPYSQGDLETSETLIRRFRTGYSDDFGLEVETAWYLFNLLGMKAPPGFDATLKLDYFSKRGPGVGINADYQREDYYGLARNYYIHDHGEDDFGPLRDNTPDDENRGRILWRHRHYLPNDWEATLELAYASDPGFLEEYEKNEWFTGKQQETVFYLKRAQEVDAITLLANWRLLDFVTQTEHLPDLTYRRIGDTFADPLVLYHESRVGGVRYRPDDRHFFDEKRFNNNGLTDVTFRTDAREEAELPLKLKSLNIVPFASLRGSYWDGQPLAPGGLWRGLGVYGMRGGTYFSRVYDGVHSELFDINRIRHIIRPDFAVWWSHSNADSDNITPFDEGIETINDFYGGKIGLHQTWQTKRGGKPRAAGEGEGEPASRDADGPSAKADGERTVDLLTLDLELGWFGGEGVQGDEKSNGYVNPLRPEDSRSRNYFAGDMAYRMSDTTTLLYDFNFDLNDGKFDRHDVSIAVERLPRLAYVLGYRHAGDIDLDLVGGGFNYKLNEKHITAFRLWYDTDRGELGEMTISYVRKLPRWYFAVNLEIDEVFDDVSVSVSLWPEGIQEWTLGSKRFSTLGKSVGIRP